MVKYLHVNSKLYNFISVTKYSFYEKTTIRSSCAELHVGL